MEAVAWRCVATGEIIGPADHAHRMACGQDPAAYAAVAPSAPAPGAGVPAAEGGDAPSVDPAAFTHRQLVRMAKDLGLDGSGGKADIAGRIAGLADQSAVAAAVAALAT